MKRRLRQGFERAAAFAPVTGMCDLGRMSGRAGMAAKVAFSLSLSDVQRAASFP